MLEGILRILHTGARWCDLPDQYPSPSTCWRRLSRWEEDDVWLDIWRAFLSELDEQGSLDWSESFADGSFTPAKGGDAVGPTRRGKGTKWMVVVDGQGLPVGKQLISASPHESRFIETTVQDSFAPATIIRMIYDKAADGNARRARMAELGIDLIAPELRCRKTHVQDKRKLRRYRRRWKMECTFAWLGNYRRLVVRLRTRRVTNWKEGKMVLRWAATAFLATEANFRRITGHRELWTLKAFLDEARPTEKATAA